MNGHHGGVYAFFRWLGWLIVAGWVVQGIGMVPHCAAGNGSQQVVHLYFADAKKPFLAGESRLMVNSGDPISLGRQLVVGGSGRPYRWISGNHPHGNTTEGLFHTW